VKATGTFLASVVVSFAALSISESVPCVTDAYCPLVRFTWRPVSISRRATVVPRSFCVWLSFLFVQAEPVIIRIKRRSMLTSQNVHTITVKFNDQN